MFLNYNYFFMNIIKKIKEKNRIKKEMKDVSAIRGMVVAHLNEIISFQSKINEDLFEVTAFLLDEIGDALSAIITLKKDHLKSSIMISRYILESCVNLLYIYKEDSEKRALNCRAFSAKILLKRMLQSQEDDGRVKGEILRVKERADKHRPSGKNKNHWDGLSIRIIMENLNLNSMYDDWYIRMSSYTHPQYRGSKITTNGKGEYVKYLKNMVFKDLNLSILYSLKAINKKFNLLEGIVVMENYPKEKAMFVFSINEHRESKNNNINL